MSEKKLDHLVNHVILCLDESSSMGAITAAMIEFVDRLVKSLADDSTALGQETRLSVYAFGSEVTNYVWDIDVLRFPSIKDWYDPDGMTALISCALRAIEDVKEIPTKYGDHAYLLYVITDGEENYSPRIDDSHTPTLLKAVLKGLPEEWTVAAAVPDARSKMRARSIGFAPGNIEVWDATSERGVEEATKTIVAATSAYVRGRSAGTRGTTSLFTTDATAVNAQTIDAAGMTPLDPKSYMLVPVAEDTAINVFVRDTCGLKYILGRGYYELTKREKIQPQKSLIIAEKLSGGRLGRLYMGGDARKLLNLSETEEVSVKPDWNPDYAIFVESQSTNRKLRVGQRFVYLR